MEVRIVNEPDVEPVTLAEVKEYCHIDADYDVSDMSLSLIASSARELLEMELNLSLAIQTLEVSFCGGTVRLPRSPVREVLSLEINGEVYTGSYKLYGDFLRLHDYVDEDRVIIYPVGYERNFNVTVRYTAGYDRLPAPLKHAILMQIDYDLKGQGEEVLSVINPNALKKAESYSKNLYIQ